MVLRPIAPTTESIAQVEYRGDLVHVSLLERDDRFKRLLKNRGFAWDWDTRRWERTVGESAGPGADRAAETAHVLLAAGYCVEVEEAVARMILDVSYEPEKRRLIARRKSGEFAGWFVVQWPRGEDYWRWARRLPGSRYDRPCLVVPPEQFEAVQDFAEHHGFWISPAAERIIDAAAAHKRAAIIIDVPPLPTNGAAKARLSEVGIDPELADDDEPL